LIARVLPDVHGECDDEEGRVCALGGVGCFES
jgi:hypothetical protein